MKYKPTPRDACHIMAGMLLIPFVIVALSLIAFVMNPYQEGYRAGQEAGYEQMRIAPMATDEPPFNWKDRDVYDENGFFYHQK